jgi:hypothetical protein
VQGTEAWARVATDMPHLLQIQAEKLGSCQLRCSELGKQSELLNLWAGCCLQDSAISERSGCWLSFTAVTELLDAEHKAVAGGCLHRGPDLSLHITRV